MTSLQAVKGYPAHEFAGLFPIDDGEPLAQLTADIRAHGQRELIVLYGGQVLDGRRRQAACLAAGVVPKSREFTGSTDEALALVMSLNLHRRHLDASQLGLIGAKAREIYDRLAKENMQVGKGHDGSGGRGNKKNPEEKIPQGLREPQSRDRAGEAVGVNGKYIDAGTKVLKHGSPELVKAVDDGTLHVADAAKVVKESPEVQRQAVEAVKTGQAPTAKAAVETITSPKSSANVRTPTKKDEFAAVLAAIPSFDEVVRQLDLAKRMAAKLKNLEAGRFLNLQSVERTIDSVKRDITFAAPHAKCPYCRGNKLYEGRDCAACFAMGWVSKGVFDATPAEFKEGKHAPDA